MGLHGMLQGELYLFTNDKEVKKRSYLNAK
jgi:hypothetical protein